jgi:HD-GYP domain-containing protein (c-di-GMP phosphodiesterase class II)
MEELANLGLAALLKDIGAIMLPQGLMDRGELLGDEALEARKHPLYSARIIGQYERFSSDVVSAIAFHHERWDGSGYPRSLGRDEIPLAARIIGIADSYYELVSRRAFRKAYMPHEAVEYIMAFAGELFDPELAGLFARQVPLYPMGITVKLNTGELGIVADSNSGHIGRPIVRICYDEKTRPVSRPYNVDLSEPENQKLMIVEVLDY